MNKTPFSYHSSWGSTFECDTCDFSTPMRVRQIQRPKTINELDFYSRDLAEMIGYHATNIWPKLNGFQGYDCIKFDFTK